jgi:hypothetical protein
MAICQSLLLFHLYSSDFRTTARAFHGNLSISFLFHLYSSDFACSIIILKELLWQLVFVQSSFDGFALDVFVWFFFCCVLSTCIIIKEQLLMQQLHSNQRSIFILCQNHHHHLQARGRIKGLCDHHPPKIQLVFDIAFATSAAS